MKNRLLANTLIALGLVGSAGAVVMDSPEAFFYNAGYKKGYSVGKKQGYVEGYKQALEDIKKVLRAYSIDIKALESGKFLYKEGLVTYPRVYRLKDEHGYRVVVKGCMIEDIRSLDQIFGERGVDIPILDISTLVESKEAQNRIIRFPELSRKIEEETRVPPTPIFLQVSSSAKSLLEKYNIPYTVEETSTGEEIIRAVFFNDKEAKEFCAKNKGVCNREGGKNELEEY